ncbi:probable Phosphoribosylglycinamide formyltransferase [Saccharomycodes ludwigii]|uniref:Phosphoribosylglycinamide formyltransferase n=1 Tax=Saccharomycodes ludwigii TaxID=36035 RepID=A0A376B809_9ASCO|nr:hypothetical protein SCDLUD_003285 [Saccharomycodes ludwigii]KAH3900313.1 hypothetical protein SCDLUD_003285 [Saccharomycodes ludwigii]SSD60827.1 probable Phosphoribosylglycinamide formyltransferase [Saccharomycodes ludwigii]
MACCKRHIIPVLAVTSLLAIGSYFYLHKQPSTRDSSDENEDNTSEKKQNLKKTSTPTKKVTVLISGSGSNLQALIDAIHNGPLDHNRVVINKVISSSKKAYGLTRAADNNIPTSIHALYNYTKNIPKEDKKSRADARKLYEKDLASLILQDKPDLIVCAGWLLILGPTFLSQIDQQVPIINLHPALPGAFDGTVHAIEMAWNKCQELKKPFIAGCMVHYVIEDVDKGKPILVKKLTIVPGKETLEDYETRVHSAEHIAIVEATAQVLGL